MWNTCRVEKILRHLKKGRHTEYLVKWLGFADYENSWVSEKDLAKALDRLKQYKTAYYPTKLIVISHHQNSNHERPRSLYTRLSYQVSPSHLRRWFMGYESRQHRNEVAWTLIHICISFKILFADP